MAQYIPLDAIWLGKLPETENTNPIEFNVKRVLEEHGVNNATEFFIYLYITTRDDSERFRRGYFEIFTTRGENKATKQNPSPLAPYMQYMNVATGPAITTIDSANLWFPMGVDGKLKIKLIHPTSKTKSIKCPLAGDQWSDVFLIGYRI